MRRRVSHPRLSFDPNIVELESGQQAIDKVVNLFGSYGHELIDVLRHLQRLFDDKSLQIGEGRLACGDSECIHCPVEQGTEPREFYLACVSQSVGANNDS
jgi:cytochrome c